MKVQLLNPFISAFNQATMMIFDCAIEKRNIEIIDAVKEGTDVHVFLGLAGDLYGTVFLSSSKESALHIASSMEGRKFEDFDEISVSALQELINITSGGAITEFSEMGIDADITPPTFVEGKDVNIRLFYPIISVQLYVNEVSVYLNLAVKKRKPQRVLIVENNTVIRERLVHTLKLNKFHVVSDVACGDNCIDLIESKKPNIIIYDMSSMDKQDYFVLQKINESYPKIKVVATTLMDQNVEKDSLPRVDDYVSKPIQDDILLTVLKSV